MTRTHYDHDGYQWLWWYEDRGKYYCTNEYGEGVFYVNLSRNERKQLKGTCQFSLRGIKDPRAKIRRLMNDR